MKSNSSEPIHQSYRWRRQVCLLLALFLGVRQFATATKQIQQDGDPATVAGKKYSGSSKPSSSVVAGLENQITIVVLTADEKRFVDLQDIVCVGVNHTLVEEIVIVWNEPSAPEGAARLKLLLKEAIERNCVDCSISKVRILKSTRNTLNNRYDPAFLQLRTGAVMILDDDLTIIEDTISCAHESWMANKLAVHSFGWARTVYSDRYGFSTRGMPPNFLLPRMIFDTAFLDVYFEEQNADIHTYVDTQAAHCDDIAFASILTKHLNRPLMWVQAPHGSRKRDGKDGRIKWLNPRIHQESDFPRKAPIEGMASLTSSKEQKKAKKGPSKAPKSTDEAKVVSSHRKLSARKDARTECSTDLIRRLNWTMPLVEQSQCSYQSGRTFDMTIEKFTDVVIPAKHKKKKEKKKHQDGIEALLLPQNISRPFPWETTILEDQLNTTKTAMSSNENTPMGRISFLHIPKSGGSSIVSLASQHNLSWGECLFLHKIPKLGMDCPPVPTQTQQWPNMFPSQRWWHTPIQYFPSNVTNPYRGYDLFAVIRNPYDRAVSEFFYYCNLKKKDKCEGPEDDPAELMNAHIQKSILRFREAERNTSGYYRDFGHWIPQYDFFYDTDNNRVVKYMLHLEQLKEQSDSLMRVYYGSNNGGVRLSEELVRSRKEYSFGVKDLTPSTRKLIETVYEQDFVLAGYQMLPDTI